MSKRVKADPSAWRDSPNGTAAYQAARSTAQRQANADGFDRGIEANNLFKIFTICMLPARENRQGFELRCEVVSCETLEKCQKGHGPR
jgi:hypothetical protein